MNSPNRITRYLVKAVAAGSLVIAAALPAAIATTAGAATAPVLSAVSLSSTGSAVAPANETSSFTLVTTLGSTTATLETTYAGSTATPVASTGYTITDAAGSELTGGTDTFTSAASGTISHTGVSITLGTTPAASGTDVVTLAETLTPFTALTSSSVTGAFSGTGTSGTSTITLTSNTTSVALVAGDTISGTGITAGTTTGAATVTTAGTAVTLSQPLTANATGTYVVTLAPAALPAFGAGGLPSPGETIYVSGTGFAANGGNVTITSSNPDLSFTGVTEVSSILAKATLTTTAATTSGYASITLTDANGVSLPLANALLVNPDPTISSVSPTSLANGQTATVTVTGTGIDASGDVLTFTNIADGTTLTGGTFGLVTSTSNTASALITATNSVTHAAASTGTYAVTLTNFDGGSVTTGAVFSVTAAGITNVSPSELAPSVSTNVTVTGAGFEPNTAANTLVFTCANGATAAASNVVVVSPTTITASVLTGTATGLCTVTVNNPSVSLGGNGAVFTAVGGLGVNTPATTAATITAATLTPNTPIVPGSTVTTPVTLSLVGTGFGSTSTVAFVYGASNTIDGGVTGACTSATTGTTMTCSVSVGTGAVAGIHGVEVLTGGAASNVFANALTVSGPTITSASPSTVAMDATVGTVITLTGTGLNSTATLFSSGNLQGTFAVTSPTTATFALTSTPTAIGTSLLTITEYVASGVQVKSAPFALSVTAAPTIASLQNTLVTTLSASVGAGAVNVPVLITGTGFETGATIGSFVSPYGVADAGVTATVKSINTGGTQIVALVSIKAGDANISDGYTITNPDGGFAKVAGFSTGALFINTGPTITAVSPATVLQNTTTAFTITGTGFVRSSVQPSANGTCGIATVTGTTSIAVTCTFSAATATAASLVVTNADGGSATSATVLAATTTTTTPPPVTAKKVPFTKGTHGVAVVGRTSSLVLLGGNFYGQPRITSNEAGTRAVVSKDSGNSITIRITVGARSVAGWHTLTITLADGKSCKDNYKVIR